MKPDDCALFCRLAFEKAGIVLGPDKAYLVETRLVPVARKHGFAGLDGLANAMRGAPPQPLLHDFLDALTTNETFFFRDTKPFDEFRRHVLPALIKERAGTKQLRIWSAACSTGQEAYSLAMILTEEAAKLHGWRIEIIGTDISTEAVGKARAGVYSQFEVQRGMPIQMLVKYFQQDGDKWQVAPALKQMAQFREFNLLNDPAVFGRFDVVFCRNVLIYFDMKTKAAVLGRIAKIMAPDGTLFLGGAETVLGVSDRFEIMPDHRGLYRLATQPGGAAQSAAPRPTISTSAH